VVEQGRRQDTLAFQVDLWSAPGELPGNLADVVMRQKEIQYFARAPTPISSRRAFRPKR
jgi:NTE family protein